MTKCETCQGSGKVERNFGLAVSPCPVCKGAGMITDALAGDLKAEAKTAQAGQTAQPAVPAPEAQVIITEPSAPAVPATEAPTAQPDKTAAHRPARKGKR